VPARSRRAPGAGRRRALGRGSNDRAFTTNQLVTQWGTVFADGVLASAILDRLLHQSHTMLTQDDSYRRKQKRKAGLVPRPSNSATGEGQFSRND